MVAPITGPVTVVHLDSGNNGVSAYKAASRYRQKKPYNLRLPYRMLNSVCYSYKNWTVPTGVVFQGGGARATGSERPMDLYLTPSGDPLPSLRNQALSRAWDKLNGEISDSAEWLVTVLQAQQAIDMAAARVVQFTRFVTAVKRLRFGDAAKALHIDARSPQVQEAEQKARRIMRGRNKAQAKIYGSDARFSNLDLRLGGAVLEYNFGWAPTIGDIYSTVDLLQSEVPTVSLKGKGKAEQVVTSKTVNGSGTIEREFHYIMKAALAGDIIVENPNLFLANRLGLLNPAVVLYEMTPWSFVGNWFLNLETMIRAYSPQWGYRWENATTTFSLYSSSNVNGLAYNQSKAFAAQLRFSQTRTTGLTKPRLGFRPFSLPLTRLANATALLNQLLRK